MGGSKKLHWLGLETSAIVTGIRARLDAILAAPQGALPAVCRRSDSASAGSTIARAQRLAEFVDVLVVDNDQIRFVPTSPRHQRAPTRWSGRARQLSAEGALQRVARRALRRRARIRRRTACSNSSAARHAISASARLQRTSTASSGRRTASACGWAGAARTRPIDPGLLDNMVGGGIAAGASVEATVIKEAGEEAGIPAALAATARAAGTLRICRAHPKGLERETVYVHDLWLDPAFVPDGHRRRSRGIPARRRYPTPPGLPAIATAATS